MRGLLGAHGSLVAAFGAFSTAPDQVLVYNTPAFGPGIVFVGTDRILAFGLESETLARRQRIQR
jgi:hypothetical protein